MRTVLPVRPRLHRVLAPVALLAIAAASAPAALLVLAACRQEPRAPFSAAVLPAVQLRPALTLGDRWDVVMGVPAVDRPFRPCTWDYSIGAPRSLRARGAERDLFVDILQPEIDRSVGRYVVALAPSGGDL